MTKRAFLSAFLLMISLVNCAPALAPTPPAATLAPQVIAFPSPVAPATLAPSPVVHTNPFPPAQSASSPTAIAGTPAQGPLTPATMIGTPAPPPALAGKFVFAPGDGSIWITDAATRQSRALIANSPGLFPDAPAFSPDGTQVAYTLGRFSNDNKVHPSLHLIDANGTRDRILLVPNDPLAELYWPAFSPDGKWVYYTATRPVAPNGVQDDVERVGVDGRGVTKVLDNAELASLSPDGKHVTFLRFNSKTFSSGLWIADADGRNPKRLVADDVFMGMLSPRFSPDGEWIVFSASGPPAHPLPGALLVPKRDCQPALLCALAEPAQADGLPWDLWLVRSDGSRFQQLTNVGFDSPWPAWSHDGKYIAIFETSGFYVLDVERRLLSQWQPEGGHGVLDWWTSNSK